MYWEQWLLYQYLQSSWNLLVSDCLYICREQNSFWTLLLALRTLLLRWWQTHHSYSEVGNIKPCLSLTYFQIHMADECAFQCVWWVTYCSRWKWNCQRLLTSVLQLPWLRSFLILEHEQWFHNPCAPVPAYLSNLMSTTGHLYELHQLLCCLWLLWPWAAVTFSKVQA